MKLLLIIAVIGLLVLAYDRQRHLDASKAELQQAREQIDALQKRLLNTPKPPPGIVAAHPTVGPAKPNVQPATPSPWQKGSTSLDLPAKGRR